jgi:hypothetical protein
VDVGTAWGGVAMHKVEMTVLASLSLYNVITECYEP